MPEKKPTAREQMRIDRERAQARSEAKFEALTENYPLGHEARREAFVRVESEKMVKELEQRQLEVTPESDRRKRR